MNVDIICPLYNAEKYLSKLDDSLRKQENVNINKIIYVLTKSDDNTENILKSINANYYKIEKKDFSHSLTRENIAKKSTADIIVFITQDIEIQKNDWLKKLILPIENGDAEASYSRQISKYNNIEKYVREINYPNESAIKSKENLKNLGINTFFSSDVSSAINSNIFKKLNWYDGKNFSSSEDMYITYKLIINGYRVKYCADSIIYHSHNYTLKQLYLRYYNYGTFLKENPDIDKYGTNRAGFNLGINILKSAIKNFDIKTIICLLPNMIVRAYGKYRGKRGI